MLLGMFKNMFVFVLVSVPRNLRLTSMIHSLGLTKSVILWQLWRERPFLIRKAAPHPCLQECPPLSKMCARHVCVCLGPVFFRDCQNKANGKVEVYMCGNPGEEVFDRMLAGPSGGPTHNSSIFDCVTLLDHESSRCKERAVPREWQRHQHWPSY